MSPDLQTGLVMRSTGSWYQVLTEDKSILKCRMQGKFRLDGIQTTNPIVVGDYVGFEDKQDGTGVIRSIRPRKNYIIRKSVNLSHQAHIIAANVDQAYLIVTLKAPATSTEFIDRFLVAADINRIPVSIVFNKIDIYCESDRQCHDDLVRLYTEAGYECIAMSALHTDDVAWFRTKLTDKVNLLAGHSGVGKSTLISAVEDGLDLKTAEVSEHYREGRHTTTFAEVFPLSNGGLIIDTPGIKGFGVIQAEKKTLAHHFPEMLKLLPDCKFSNCVHMGEPKCAVKEAVETGGIAQSRYDSYQSIYATDEIETYR